MKKGLLALALLCATGVLAQLQPPAGFGANGQQLVTPSQLATGPTFTLLTVDQVSGVDSPTCGVALPCKNIMPALGQLQHNVQALERVQIDAGTYYGTSNLIDNVVTASHLEKGLPGTYALDSFLPDISVGLLQGTGYGPEYPTDGGSAVTTIDTTSIMPKVLIEGQMGMVVDGGTFTATSGSDVNSLITINQTGAGWQVNQYAGMFVKILAGSGVNPQSVSPAADTNIYAIASNTATALSVVDVATQPMPVAPDSTTQYQIVQPTVILHPETLLADGGIGTDGPQETFSIAGSRGMGASNSLAGLNQNTGSIIELRYVTIVQGTPGGHAALGIHSANVRLWGVQLKLTATNSQGALAADNSTVETLRSTVVQTAGGTARGAVDLQGSSFGSIFDGTYIVGLGNGIELEGVGGQINILSSYTIGGNAAAILMIGPGYARIASLGNAYATSTSGAALQVQRGAVARITNAFANASGNSGTWGVRCSQTGAVFISSSTTATGTTGDASPDGVSTSNFASIRAASPPAISSPVENCYVGQE